MSADTDGWIGSKHQLDNVLLVYGCDRDEDGRFILSGSVSSFMGGGEEYVVGADARALITGQWTALVPLLRSTSYGMAITVYG